VLRYLAENAGRLVGKDELIAAVWPGVFVIDESVARCISDVRQALGDTRQEIIRTVPRRGYLLAAPVARASPTECDRELLLSGLRLATGSATAVSAAA
jgi:DNA-binding winged helix-turn-helix (wHTH) protein